MTAVRAADLRRARIVVSLGVLLPLVALLGSGAVHAVRQGRIPELGCWLLARGQTMTNPDGATCPLRMRETVRLVAGELGPQRDGSGKGRIKPSILPLPVNETAFDTGVAIGLIPNH